MLSSPPTSLSFRSPVHTMGKHVHFAESNTIYSPLHLPTATPSRLTIHPLLSTSTPLNINLSQPPSSIPLDKHGIALPTLFQPATHPPVPFLTITSPSLPWPIKLIALASTPGPYITVSDVLEAMYKFLRKAVSASEFGATSPSMQATISRAYYQRGDSIIDQKEKSREMQKGVKRIDFLGKNRMFNGISCIPGESGRLELHLRRDDTYGRASTSHIELDTLEASAKSATVGVGAKAKARSSKRTRASPSHQSDPGSPIYQGAVATNIPRTLSLAAEENNAKDDARIDRPSNTTNINQFQTTEQNIPRQPHPDNDGAQAHMIEDNSIPPHEQFEPSAAPRMFEQAHDFTIAGGQFYSVAGNVSIDSSHDASTHSIKVTNLWQYNHSLAQHRHIEVKPDPQIQQTTIEKALPHDVGDLPEDKPPHEDRSKLECRDAETSIVLELEFDDTLASPSTLSELDNFDVETEETQTLIKDCHLTPFLNPTMSEISIDDLMHDLLSRYPLSPLCSASLLHRAISALILSFSPLSLTMLAALLNFDSEQQVKQILLPASPFILVPDLDEREVGNSNQAPVRFMDPSIPPFFLDRMRSRQYYVDPLVGHRALLKACTRIMVKWNEEAEKPETIRWGWRDAYEYASRNWERHLLAGSMCHRRMRSKL